MQKLTIIFIFYSALAYADKVDFMTAQDIVLEHDLLKSSKYQAMAQEEAASVAGAWGDPTISIGVANLPIDENFKRDVTPMSGIVFGITQKIPLGARATKKEEAARAKAQQLLAINKFDSQRMLAKLWEQLIKLKMHTSDLKFLKENELWLKSMVQVSKKLYSNGKNTQQALLDIQIRHNQVLANIADKESVIEKTNSSISYLLGESKTIKLNSIPWEKVKVVTEKDDLLERSWESAISAAEYEKSAANWSKLPDATVGLNYIKRSNIDGNGDFVGFSISIPLPFGVTTSSAQKQASRRWLSAKSGLNNYKRQRASTIHSLAQEAKALEKQLELMRKSLNFARTARETSSKSYRIGGISYFDLLQAELRLQEIEFKSNEISARLTDNFIQQKLWNSDMVIK